MKKENERVVKPMKIVSLCNLSKLLDHELKLISSLSTSKTFTAELSHRSPRDAKREEP